MPKCAACGSGDTAAMFDTFVCHNCGAVTNYKGAVVAAETTEPVPVENLVTTMGPADTTDPDHPTRVVSSEAGDETVDADPGAFDRVAVVGSREYDELYADVPEPEPAKAKAKK